MPGSQPARDSTSSPRLRLLRGREQAAAVCYRVGSREIEFLLVRTRGGRWTFPKGGLEPGLTHAQSAALEAFEEAGVHGRIEVTAFARYVHQTESRSAVKPVPVLAFLCEVRRLVKPQESKRNRTWFPAEKAKRRLQQGRTAECGMELAAVVDRAAARVRRLRDGEREEARRAQKDPLQHVCLEASPTVPESGALTAAIAGFLRRQARTSPAIDATLEAHLQGALSAIPAPHRTLLRLGSGNRTAIHAAQNVTAIDGPR